MEANHDPYGALRFRDYRSLLSGGVLAGIGAEIQAVAVNWELWQRTQSAADLGIAGLCQFLPVLLFSLIAGQAADRYSRKWILIAAQVMMTFVSVGLAALSYFEGPVPLIFLVLLLAGCCRAFGTPARVSLVPMVVPLEQLGNAVTWNSSGWHIANMAGPALGGLFLAYMEQPAAAYLLAGCCTLTCAALVTRIMPRAAIRSTEPRSLASLLAGIRFVWKTKLILAAITLDLFAVLLGGATALLPIYADTILHVGPTGFGWLRASPAIGAFIMAMFMAHRPPLRRAGQTLLLSVAGFGLATVGFGLSEDPLFSFVLLALTGAFDNISVVVRGTLMQVLTPDAMRGRVAAVSVIFISSSNELGAFESGITAHFFGPVASVVGGGIGTLLVVAAASFLWPNLLDLGAISSKTAEP